MERCSALLSFRSGAGGRLHQTRIRAQPSRSDGAEVRMGPPRPETILCPHAVLFKTSTPIGDGAEAGRGSVSGGLGGGADEPSLRSSLLFLKAAPGERCCRRTLRSSISRARRNLSPLGQLEILHGSLCVGLRSFGVEDAGISAERPGGQYPITWFDVGGMRGVEPLSLCSSGDRSAERRSGAGAGVQSTRTAAGHLTMDRFGTHRGVSRRRYMSHSGCCGSSSGSTLAAPVRRSAHPLPSSCRHEPLQIEWLVSPEHEVDGAADLGRENAQGLRLAGQPD